jgi:PAS domain S-box-containing protein
MWIFDLYSLQFLAFNNAAVRMYGFDHAKFRQLTPADLYVPDEVTAFLEECTRKGSSSQAPAVWRHLTKDGAVIDVELTTHDLVYGQREARLVVAYDLSRKAHSHSQDAVASTCSTSSMV